MPAIVLKPSKVNLSKLTPVKKTTGVKIISKPVSIKPVSIKNSKQALKGFDPLNLMPVSTNKPQMTFQNLWDNQPAIGVPIWQGVTQGEVEKQREETFKGINQLLSILTNGELWLNIGVGIFGIILIVVGLYLLANHETQKIVQKAGSRVGLASERIYKGKSGVKKKKK